MKGRESSMPAEEMWSSFFNVELALDQLMGVGQLIGDLTEFGCGYGTFTLPTAHRVEGFIHAMDIDLSMVNCVQAKARSSAIGNICAVQRDFVASGSGRPDLSQAHVMVYNLLHLENPVDLLKESHRILKPDGKLSVIHWRRDIPTPRGPNLAIRPSPNQCRDWMIEAGFKEVTSVDLRASCPYHFGLVASP